MTYLDKTFKIIEALVSDKVNFAVKFSKNGFVTINIKFNQFTIYVRISTNVIIDIDGSGNYLDALKVSLFYYYIKSLVDKALSGE